MIIFLGCGYIIINSLLFLYVLSVIVSELDGSGDPFNVSGILSLNMLIKPKRVKCQLVLYKAHILWNVYRVLRVRNSLLLQDLKILSTSTKLRMLILHIFSILTILLNALPWSCLRMRPRDLVILVSFTKVAAINQEVY